MAANSVDVIGLLEPAQMADEISKLWIKWNADRRGRMDTIQETREYLYATDTSTTTAGRNPFKNSTHTPKLAQIQQNLKANYMSHMFSNPEWINWEAHDFASSAVEKARAVESYIRTKAEQSHLVEECGRVVDDWIDNGDGFARMRYVNETHTDAYGNVSTGYIGPKLERVSIHDIVFNIAASSWERSPKIIRSLVSIGELARMAEDETEATWTRDVLAQIVSRRKMVRSVANISESDMAKATQYLADGFSSITQYYNSDLVEVLEFFGDWFDQETMELKKNHHMVVVDRVQVVQDIPINSWHGRPYIYHVRWRDRPDNLMGMGPLDNLVGMQYKIDKLENLRADIFDQIATPDRVEIGSVESYGDEGVPGKVYVVDENGRVEYLRPDATVLQADLQIANTMAMMDDLAGAPREAMGIRSPGEKTKFEVQVLDNAANRLFRNKVRKFETDFIEVVLNDMLEMARRNLNATDVIRAQDHVFGAAEFMNITKDDVTAVGLVRARGSLYFEKQANTLQNLNMVFNSSAGQLIVPHLSKKKLAKVVEDLLSVDQYALFGDNVGVLEDIETKRIMQSGDEALSEEAATNGSLDGENDHVPIG